MTLTKEQRERTALDDWLDRLEGLLRERAKLLAGNDDKWDIEPNDIATLRALLAAFDAAQRDAERWRWLIANSTRGCEPLYVRGEESNGPVDDEVKCTLWLSLPPRPAFYANPDAAIDAALAATNAQAGGESVV